MKIRQILVMLLAAIGLIGCSGSGSAESITIGSKTFTESLVLNQILVQYLESLEYEVVDETGLGESAIIRTALTSDEIDGYFEYTGTGVVEYMQHEPVFDAQEAYQLLRDWDAENGITWLPYAEANNTYVMVCTPALAEEHNLSNVSDLARAYNEGHSIRLVTSAEAYERADLMPRLMELYDFDVPTEDRLNVELGLFYEALKNDQADVTTGFATDGVIERDGYVRLEDDKNAFAVYNIAPVFRTEVLEAHPDLAEQIDTITRLLDDETVTALNSKIDIDNASVEETAHAFLQEHGLVE